MPRIGIFLYFVDGFIWKNAETPAFPLKEPNHFPYNANTFYLLWPGGVGMYKIRVLAVVLVAGLLSGCHSQSTTKDTLFFADNPTATVQVQQMNFPYEIPETPLIVEKLLDYSGQYWEDGSGEPVENVAGLMVYNPTEQMMRSADFAVDISGQTLYFHLSWLPPGGRCLVLESSRQPYFSQSVTGCRMLAVRWTFSQLSSEQIDYVGLGSLLTVTNREERSYSRVTMWYKRYVPKEDYYLGGISFSARLTSLGAMQQAILNPEKYDSANARIVRIEVSE